MAAIDGRAIKESKPVGPGQAFMTSVVFLCSLGLMLFITWHYRFEMSDDAYIHLRIARNFVETGHPYFNAHEPVMVTSSPVWTLLLALNEVLLGARNVLWFWNALLAAVAATVTYLLVSNLLETARRQVKLFALFVPLTVLASLADSAFLGMETPLAVTLLLLAALAFMKPSSIALPLLAVASFTRYEMAVLFAAAIVVCLGTRTFKEYGGIAASIFTAVLTLWLFSQFGTIIPNAVAAKSKGYVLSSAQSFAMLRPQPADSTPLLNSLILLVLSVILFFLVFSWVGAVVTSKSHRDTYWIASLCLVLWGCALSGLYMWRGTYIFHWYAPLVYVPVLVGMVLMIFLDPSTLRKSAACLFLVLAFLHIYKHLELLISSAVTNNPSRVLLLSESARVHSYLAVGRALYRTCPHSQLLTSEIGALGYSFPGTILDGFGLASPDAMKYQPMQVPKERSNPFLGSIPIAFALEKHADLIVTYDHFGEAVLASAEIHSQYDDLTLPPLQAKDAAEGRTPPWGIKTLHVLVRKNGECPVAMATASVR